MHLKTSNFLHLLAATLIVCLVFFRCASPGSIQGGPKDETPPVVDSTNSTPTPQTNFTPQEIIISFDEWVKLDDPFNQIFISPPLEKRPQYQLKKKSLIISFDEEEELRENTTYIVNLGTSIQDITESNPLEDYQFVFSTGEVLDSLGFSGVITDALTGKPVENASVMLYSNLADSAISTLPPSYFARTNKAGEYRFNYLRADTFQLLAYVDEDLDFRHSEEIEPLGFIPQPISTNQVNDSTLNFTLSLGPPPVYLDNVDTATSSLIVLTFSGPITDSASLQVTADPIRHIDRINNQLRIYYHPDSLPVRVVTENNKGLRDTINVRSTDKKSFDANDLEIARVDPTLLPSESLEFKTNWPLQSLDVSQIQMEKQRDSQRIDLDTMFYNFNTFQIKYPWKADSSYQMTLFPGALQFENDLSHDTITYRIQPVAPESLASLEITLTAAENYRLPPQFLLRLKQKDKVITEKTTSELDKKQVFSSLKPGAYTLEVIWDENQNGIWDPARYPGRRPAEQIQKVEIENLRVNWIQETEVNLISE